MDETKPLRQEVEEIKELINSGRVKKLRLPRRAKVKKGRIKKNWVGLVKVDENGSMSGTKVQVEGSAFNLGANLNNANYHATTGKEIVYWEGKFPVIFQETKKLNPKNFTFNEGDNETYGQPFVQAKMLKDVIKVKPKGGKGILIIGVIGVALFVVGKYVFKWF